MPITCSVLFALVLAVTPRSQDVSRPAFTVFDSDTQLKAKAQHAALVDLFCPPKYQRKWDPKRAEAMEKKLPHQFGDPDSFRPVYGHAYAIDGGGKIQRVRFRSIPDRSSFERFIDSEISRRGKRVVRSGEELRVKLSKEAVTQQKQGDVRVNRSWKDAFYAGSEHLVAWGDSTAWKINLRDIDQMAHKGRNISWGIYTEPKRLSDRHRRIVLDRFRAQLGVHGQRRNNEPVQNYLARSLLVGEYMSLVVYAMNDTQTCLITTAEPTQDLPWHFRMELTVERASDLAKRFKELRANPRMQIASEDSPIAEFTLALKLPKNTVPVLRQVFTEGLPDSNFLNRCLLPTLEARRLVSRGRLDSDADHGLVAAGFVEALTEDTTTIDMPALLDGQLTPDGLINDFPIGSSSHPYLLQTRSQTINGAISFGIGESAVRAQRIKVTNDRDAIRSGTVFEAKGDLSAIPECLAHPETRKCLEAIETWYNEHIRQQWRPAMRAGNGGFTSLLDTLVSDGDWKFSASVRVSPLGDRVLAECSVGRDLYGWLCARKFVSQIDAQK